MNDVSSFGELITENKFKTDSETYGLSTNVQVNDTSLNINIRD